MRAGRLRHRLELQERSVTRDSYGAEVETWTTQHVIWGSVEPLSGSEYFASKQTQAERSHKIIIRYISDLHVTWRIKFGSRTFGIESIINRDERNRELTLMCSESL